MRELRLYKFENNIIMLMINAIQFHEKYKNK